MWFLTILNSFIPNFVKLKQIQPFLTFRATSSCLLNRWEKKRYFSFFCGALSCNRENYSEEERYNGCGSVQRSWDLRGKRRVDMSLFWSFPEFLMSSWFKETCFPSSVLIVWIYQIWFCVAWSVANSENYLFVYEKKCLLKRMTSLWSQITKLWNKTLF